MRTRPSWAVPTAVATAALAAVAVLPAAQSADAATAPAVVAPVDWPTYLVTVHRDVDPTSVAAAHGITPEHVFRIALHGFSARLSPEQVAALRVAPSVESVEEDGLASAIGPAV
ncbi:protease inhibitor I9 family protein [Streptomyces sp. RerS4]|uniref:protease inhibitor I9 family protein n=1 Tax=Streptomyces sp. RerS4 TaxID=2942449 RepID=UPI0024BFF2B8|nr:protease inhibitor I9 family protein [Streptomyces sp. RerS4]